MAGVSGIKSGRLPEPPIAIQIDTTLHRFKSRASSGFPVHGVRFNRTRLRFYDIFLNSHPSIPALFAHTDFSRQKALLRSGIAMLVMHAQGDQFGTRALDKIAESHSKAKLNINPCFYPLWIDSLIQAIKECDPELTPALEAEWRRVLEQGASYIISRHNK